MQTGHRFRITGLPPEPFRHLFGLSDAKLTYLHEGRNKQISQTGDGKLIREILS